MIQKTVRNRNAESDIKDAIQLAKTMNQDVMVMFDNVFAFVNKDSVVKNVMAELYNKMSERNFMNAFIRPRNK